MPAIGAALLVASAQAQEVDIQFGALPVSVKPGDVLPVPFHFEKDAGVEESRLVFVVELLSSSGTTLSEKLLDNDGAGYKGEMGDLEVEFLVPGQGEYTVKAYAAPWSMNRWVVEEMYSWPTDGTFTYLWSGGGYGVMENIFYLNTLIAPKPSGNTTYCSGAAFNIAAAAYLDYQAHYGRNTMGTMSVDDMRRFRQVWYGTLAYPDPELKLAALAIPQEGVGIEVTDLEEVQRGDFVQLWRHSGSGHNPIFEEWIRDNSGNITGMRYWGSQSSTNGLGSRTEYFGETSGIDINRTFFGRIVKPRDEGDKEFALATEESSSIFAQLPTPTPSPTPTTTPIAGTDRDRDGLSDGQEADLGTMPGNRDSDNDGFEDGVEIAIGTNPLDSNSPEDQTDVDADGLPDEFDPDTNTRDADDDGFADFYEVAYGTDPLDPESRPQLGDVDGSGGIDNVDGVSVIAYFLGLTEELPGTPEQADINRDGFIDNVDGVIIFNVFLGNIAVIPLEVSILN